MAIRAQTLRHLRFWLTLSFWACCALAFAMALGPGSGLPWLDSGAGTLRHVMAFSVLTFFAFLAFRERTGFTIFILLAAIGGAIEILQLIPGLHREADIKDWLVDTLTSGTILLVLHRFTAKTHNYALAEQDSARP